MQPTPWEQNLEVSATRLIKQAEAAQVIVGSLHQYDKESFIANLRAKLLSFYNDMHIGYEILLKTIITLTEKGVSLPGISDTGKKAIRNLLPNQKKLKTISEQMTSEWIEQGKPLYTLLGLSTESMTALYEAACHLLREEKAEDARVAFRFLLLLAPHIADFWTGYGISLLRLNQPNEAVASFERAVQFHPHSPETLLLLCRALVESNRKSEAQARLGARLDEAARRGDQAQYEILEAARFELVRFTPKAYI
jgi:tetratricopeptide (TPR) repeat protein